MIPVNAEATNLNVTCKKNCYHFPISSSSQVFKYNMNAWSNFKIICTTEACYIQDELASYAYARITQLKLKIVVKISLKNSLSIKKTCKTSRFKL